MASRFKHFVQTNFQDEQFWLPSFIFGCCRVDAPAKRLYSVSSDDWSIEIEVVTSKLR